MKRIAIILMLITGPAFGQAALAPHWSEPRDIRVAIAECFRDVEYHQPADRNEWLRHCIARAETQK